MIMLRPSLMVPGKKMLSARRGAVAVESAVVASVFLTLTLGILDFGLAVLNRNTLQAAACRLARSAIVRGARSADIQVPWGSATLTGHAGDGSDPAGVIAPILAVMPPDEVRIRMEWPDGDNGVGQRVRVTLNYNHDPLFGGFFGTKTWKLQAVSVMRIQH